MPSRWPGDSAVPSLHRACPLPAALGTTATRTPVLRLPNNFLDKYVQSIHYAWDTRGMVVNTQATLVLVGSRAGVGKRQRGSPNKRRKNGDRDCPGWVLPATGAWSGKSSLMKLYRSRGLLSVSLTELYSPSAQQGFGRMLATKKKTQR